MSAYMIDKDYCILLAAWGLKTIESIPTTDEVKHAAQEIYKTNVLSLQARYPGGADDEPNEFGLRHDMVGYSIDEIKVTDGLILSALGFAPAVVAKAAACAAYQCCEFEAWEATPGGELIEGAKEEAIRRMTYDPKDVPRIELVDSGAARLA